MKKLGLVLGCALLVAAPSTLFAQRAAPPVASTNETRSAQDSQEALVRAIDALGWTRSGELQIGSIARVRLPEGTMALGSADTNEFLRLNGNPPSGTAYTVAAQDLSWFAIFQFNALGYVQDEEQIDPPALLTALRQSEGPENAQRRRMGMDPLYLEGWAVEPHYDRASHNLEWGTRLRSERGEINVNYTTRLLGRSGVMQTILVTTPDTLQQDLAAFRQVLANFAYVQGQSYADFRQGDRVAEYGLTALIAGGAAAAAAKGGLFKAIAPFFKFIIVGVLALLGGAWAVVRGIFRRREEEEYGYEQEA